MDNTGEQSGLMAETLIVLTGENAWSAARGFAKLSVQKRDVDQARFWRGVALGVLKRYAAKIAISAEASATPIATPMPAPVAPDAVAEMQISAAALAASDALPEMQVVVAAAPDAPEASAQNQDIPAATPDVATADSNSAGGWKHTGLAPIPLRARRTFPMHAMAPEDATAKALVEDSAAEETIVARAA